MKKTNFKMSKKFSPIAKFSDELLKMDLSPSAKLVYSVIYFSVPSDARYNSYKEKKNPVCFRSKEKLIEASGISKSQYYRAVRELIDNGMMLSVENEVKGTIITRYELLFKMEMLRYEVKGYLNEEIIKTKFVKTSLKDKTLSPNARLILGMINVEAKNNILRTNDIKVAEFAEANNVPVSTVYNLLKQYEEVSIVTLDHDKTIYQIRLNDAYTTKEVARNQSLIKKNNKIISYLSEDDRHLQEDMAEQIQREMALHELFNRI